MHLLPNHVILKLGNLALKGMIANLRKRLQTLVEALPEESLPRAETLLTALHQDVSATSTSSTTPSSETSLLAIIQRRLPTPTQQRLNLLRQHLADEIITEVEHQELLGYVELIEQMDADRAEALIQLAQLRNINLNQVIQEFLPHPA